ncbi:unnamed protein product [Dibothriocephalus latus]|uniref:Uncharacterized protein n=1 Tax=Dibothriocephalus latus TaxID=60516 RepID=A0A3P7N5D7_DIBLA|nr:unnamed protein product [Dibothriocephalus latus]
MCFELMKEGLVGKFRWIGSLLRIVHSGPEQTSEYQEATTFMPVSSPGQLQQQQQPQQAGEGEKRCADSIATASPQPGKSPLSLRPRSASGKPAGKHGGGAKRSPSAQSIEEPGSMGEENAAFENEAEGYIEADEEQFPTEVEED